MKLIKLIFFLWYLIENTSAIEQFYVTKVFSMPIKISVNEFNLGYSTNYYSSNRCYQSQSFYQSQYSFYQSQKLKSFSYSPTLEPTIHPLETPLPTYLPTTNNPTLLPTLTPTTNKPTLLPTYLPTTNKPTLSPTLKPINIRMPTKYNVPTYAPTQSILPLLTFKTVGKLTGLSSPNLLNSDKEAIIIATSASMNINYSFVKLTNYSIVSRRRLFTLLSGYNIQYTTSINYPLTNNSISNVNTLYNSFINLLVNAVFNGAFNNYLQIASTALNATSISGATISNINTTSYNIIQPTTLAPTLAPSLKPTTNTNKNIDAFSIGKDVFDFILLLMLFGLPMCIYLLMPLFKRYYNKYKSKVNLMSVSPYPNNINTDIEQNKTKSYSLDENELTNIFNNSVMPVDNVVLLDDDIFEEIKRKMDALINQINNDSINYNSDSSFTINSDSSISSISSLPTISSSILNSDSDNN